MKSDTTNVAQILWKSVQTVRLGYFMGSTNLTNSKRGGSSALSIPHFRMGDTTFTCLNVLLGKAHEEFLLFDTWYRKFTKIILRSSREGVHKYPHLADHIVFHGALKDYCENKSFCPKFITNTLQNTVVYQTIFPLSFHQVVHMNPYQAPCPCAVSGKRETQNMGTKLTANKYLFVYFCTTVFQISSLHL